MRLDLLALFMIYPDSESITAQIAAAPAGLAAVAEAKGVAAQIFAHAGLRLVWCSRATDCPGWDGRVVVTILTTAPQEMPPKALAAASLFEGRNLRVFMDRVDGVAPREIRGKVLGHVLAHEIGHLLQACDRHSDRGVMKAGWTVRDLRAMAVRPLRFEPGDVELIRAGLAKRADGPTKLARVTGSRAAPPE